MPRSLGGFFGSRLIKFAEQISPEGGEWLRAMTVEYEHVESRAERWRWNLGVVTTMLRVLVRKVAVDNGRRPLEATVTALYLWSFSAYIAFHLVFELRTQGLREPWSEAWFPLVLCFAIAAIPAFLAIGSWLCDEFARKAVLVFTTCELVMCLMISHGHGMASFRLAKFVCNLAVFAVMLSPRVKNACRWIPVDKGRVFGLREQ